MKWHAPPGKIDLTYRILRYTYIYIYTCVSVGHVADTFEIKRIGDNQKGNGHDDGQEGGDEAEFLPSRPVRIKQLIGGLISDIWRVLGVGVLLDLDVAPRATELLLFLVVDHRRDAACQPSQLCDSLPHLSVK